MADKTMELVRVDGGLYDVTEVRRGLTIASPRGQPFAVPVDVGKKLLEDGTGRWALPGSPEATRAAGELAAHEEQLRKDREEAAKKAAAPPEAAKKPKGAGS